MTSLPMRLIDDLKLLVRTPGALDRGSRVRRRGRGRHRGVPRAAGDGGGRTRARPSRRRPRRPASAAQLQQLEQWLAQQPRVPVMAPSDGAAIVILKFNDYQCPGCGQTYRDYKPVLAKWAKQAPGKVKFITKDYPLERECNQFVGQDLHLGACEAAVAVRLAREKGKAEAMEDWLFANQPAMNPDTVKKAAATRRRRHRLRRALSPPRWSS